MRVIAAIALAGFVAACSSSAPGDDAAASSATEPDPSSNPSTTQAEQDATTTDVDTPTTDVVTDTEAPTTAATDTPSTDATTDTGAPTTDVEPVATDTGTTTTTTTVAAIRTGDTYVALGSSFASGFGIPAMGPVEDCLRSDRSYPTLVAADLGLELVDATCPGATTANIVAEAQDIGLADPLPPQIDSVASDAALITITVGGNDIAYTTTAAACHAQGDDCVGAVDEAAVREELEQLPGRLASMYSTVRERAPDARIVLVTYPKLIPPEGVACEALGLGEGGVGLVGGLGEDLQQAFLDSIESADVTLVDVYAATDGQGPCAGPDQAWISDADAVDTAPYHPTAVGHRAMADLILAAVQSE